MHFACSHMEMDTRQETGKSPQGQTFQCPFKSRMLFSRDTFLYPHLFTSVLPVQTLHSGQEEKRCRRTYCSFKSPEDCGLPPNQTVRKGSAHYCVRFFLFDFFPKNTSMLVITRYNPWQTVNSLILSEICCPAKSPQEQFWQKPPVLTASLPPSGLPHLYTPLYRHRAGKREKVKHLLEPHVHTSLPLDKQLLPTQTFTYYFLLVKPTEQWWRKMIYWRANPLF